MGGGEGGFKHLAGSSMRHHHGLDEGSEDNPTSHQWEEPERPERLVSEHAEHLRQRTRGQAALDDFHAWRSMRGVKPWSDDLLCVLLGKTFDAFAVH